MPQEISIELLLNKVEQMELLQRQHHEEMRCRGELYNTFHVLGVEMEEKIHSAMISDLLNPNGEHGCGDVFLKLFLLGFRSRKSRCEFLMDTENARVWKEYPIGYIDDDCESGGRLDILIETSDKAIVIENKIYASDQPKQISRYCRFAKKRFKGGSIVIYLTLDGHNASSESENGRKAGVDYYPISYAKDILEWLKQCTSECTYKPRLRETIAQYMDLVKQLTQQNMDKDYIEQLNETLSHYPEAAASILDNGLESLIRHCFERYLVRDLETYAQNSGLIFGQENMDKDSYKGFYFHRPEWKYYAIWMYMETPANGFYYGVSSYNEVKNDKMDLCNEVSFLSCPREAWPLGSAYPNIYQYKYWHGKTIIDMINGKFAEYIIEKVNMILTEIDTQKIAIP